jgi:hypothetical protein
MGRTELTAVDEQLRELGWTACGALREAAEWCR